MAAPIPAEVTQLLMQWSAGDREALDDLIPLVYEELRRMAHGHMAREREGHTMLATALVTEVYLKLKNERASTWANRAQFFAVAAQMMRRILVDYARQHARAKRGGGAQQVTLDDAMLVSKDNASDVLAVDEALKARATRQAQRPGGGAAFFRRPHDGRSGGSVSGFRRNCEARFAFRACLAAQ